MKEQSLICGGLLALQFRNNHPKYRVSSDGVSFCWDQIKEVPYSQNQTFFLIGNLPSTKKGLQFPPDPLS